VTVRPARRGARLGPSLLAGAAALGLACAGRAPVTEAVRPAAEGGGYRALFRGDWRGPGGRERFRLAAALLPPDRLRLEVLGPVGGPRLVVAVDGRAALALLPAERAYDSGEATRETIDRLLGIPLLPAHLVALLMGRPMCRPEAAQQQMRTRAAAAFGRTVAWYEVTCPPGDIRYRALCKERGGALEAASVREGLSGDSILEVEYGDHGEGPGPRWPRRIEIRLTARSAALTLIADEGPAMSDVAPELFAPPVPEGFERRAIAESHSAPGLLGPSAERER
jgi:hypothetical protein